MCDDTPEATRVKASLRRLAGNGEAAVIERAVEVTDEIEAAARFAETTGTGQLAAAVEATDDPSLERRGRRALEAFRLFRRAAAGTYRPGGDDEADDGDGDGDREGTPRGDRRDDHFHRGHGTDLRRGGEPFFR